MTLTTGPRPAAVRARKASASTARYLSLLIASAITVLPLVTVLFASFKSTQEYGATGPLTPPRTG